MTTENRMTNLRVSDVVSLALIGCIFVLSGYTYDLLPRNLVIHYTPPGGVYYGLETLPKPVALFVLPVTAAIAFVVVRMRPQISNFGEELESIRPYYHYATLLLVVFLTGTHIALILLNLY